MQEFYRTRYPLTMTLRELSRYNGSDPSLPVYIGVGGQIFDVSSAPQHYGPKGGYAGFAGRDATKAFFDLCFSEECLKTAHKLDQFAGNIRVNTSRGYSLTCMHVF